MPPSFRIIRGRNKPPSRFQRPPRHHVQNHGGNMPRRQTGLFDRVKILCRVGSIELLES